MNNRGFTIIEVMVAVVIISILSFVSIHYIGSTLSVSKNDTYEIMKQNIVEASYDYIYECNNNILSCNLNWSNNQTTFRAEILKDNGYFGDLSSPIDGRYLGSCWVIRARYDNGNLMVSLIDNC